MIKIKINQAKRYNNLQIGVSSPWSVDPDELIIMANLTNLAVWSLTKNSKKSMVEDILLVMEVKDD